MTQPGWERHAKTVTNMQGEVVGLRMATRSQVMLRMLGLRSWARWWGGRRLRQEPLKSRQALHTLTMAAATALVMNLRSAKVREPGTILLRVRPSFVAPLVSFAGVCGVGNGCFQVPLPPAPHLVHGRGAPPAPK